MIGLNMQLDCGAIQVRHAKDSKETVLTRSSGTKAGNMPSVLSVSEGYRDSEVGTVPLQVSNFLVLIPALVSKDIGAFPNFQHHIKLAPDAVPVAVKTYQVLYAIKGKVVAVVGLLGEQGIWEKVGKGDWAHPSVTPAKLDGSVHVTTDLFRLNKFIIPHGALSPHSQRSFRRYTVQLSCHSI